MTQVATAPRTARTAKTTPGAEEMLRDMAFVLAMTRRVRNEIVSELPPRLIRQSVEVAEVAR